MADETKVTTPTLEQAVAALGGIDKITADLDYLHTIVFSVTKEALNQVKHETKLTADEVETVFLDIQQNDDLSNDLLTAKLFAQGCIARKRSIDYAANNKLAKVIAESQSRYNRWASCNPKLAANPLTNLPVMLSYGLISQDLYTTMMEEAKKAAVANASAASAAL